MTHSIMALRKVVKIAFKIYETVRCLWGPSAYMKVSITSPSISFKFVIVLSVVILSVVMLSVVAPV
jgi:hypothetical protein